MSQINFLIAICFFIVLDLIFINTYSMKALSKKKKADRLNRILKKIECNSNYKVSEQNAHYIKLINRRADCKIELSVGSTHTILFSNDIILTSKVLKYLYKAANLLED